MSRPHGRWAEPAAPACLAACFALGVALLLLSCHGPPEAPGGSYFPMVPETRWVYALRSPRGSSQIEVRARGERSLPGRAQPVFVMDETIRGFGAGFVETSPVAYVVEGGYVARITAVDYAESGALRALGEADATLVLPLDPRPGQRWSQQTTLFQTPEGGGGSMGWSAEVRPLTSVVVPAGRFDDVVEIELVYSNLGGGSAEPQVLYRDYYARGVGLVRSVAVDPRDASAVQVEQVLLEHHPAAR